MPKIQLNDLNPNAPYNVQIRAVDGDGVDGPWSTRLSFIAAKDTVAPKPVTALAAAVVGNAMVVSWTAPTQNDSTPPTALLDLAGYKILISHGGTSFTVNTKDTNYTLTFDANKGFFVTAQGSVTFTVYAVDNTGNLSTANATTATAPTPGNVTGLTVGALLDAISVAFTAPTTGLPVDHYEIYTSLDGGTNWTLAYSGNNTTVAIPTTIYTATNVKVRAVNIFGLFSEVTYGSTVTPRSSTAIDVTPPSAPNTVTLAEAANAADVSGSSRQITVSWTKTTLESDFAGFTVQYQIVGASTWTFITISDSSARSTIITGLLPNTQYNVGVAAMDFNNNLSTYTHASVYPITTGKDTTGPATPQTPTTSGSTSRIQVTASGFAADGTTPLARDLAYFEVYVSSVNPVTATTANYVGNIVAAPTPLGTTTPIPANGTFSYPAQRTNDADASTSKTYYAAVIAVDAMGNKSGISATSSATPINLVDNLNIGAAVITDANIHDLTVTKLTAGLGLINDLTVYSKLTLGTTTGTGIIQSNDYDATHGFKLATGGLEINGGSIAAKALQLQNGFNLIPAAYADFEFQSSYYTAALSPTACTATIDTSNVQFNFQSLKVVTSTTNSVIRFAPTTTATNINTVAGQTYIASAYIFQASGSSQNFQLRFKDSVTGTTTLSSNLAVASGVMTRVSATYVAGQAGLQLGIQAASTGITYWVDGVQVEQQTGGLITPSPWKPPSNTYIDGGMIVTGSIQSTQIGTFGGTPQPYWSIDLAGSATFANALVRGHLIIGNSSDPTLTDQYIQSQNYTGTGTGATGWRIDGAGTANFNGGTITGAVFQTSAGLASGGTTAGIRIDTVNFDRIKFYTGTSNEINAPVARAWWDAPNSKAWFELDGPNLGAPNIPAVRMWGAPGAGGPTSGLTLVSDVLCYNSLSVNNSLTIYAGGIAAVGGGTWTGNITLGTDSINTSFVGGIAGIGGTNNPLKMSNLQTVTGTTLSINGSGIIGKTSSSLRYKTNVKTLEKSNVLQLRPVTFYWDHDSDEFEFDPDDPKHDARHIGLIAEEVDAAGIEELVIYDTEGRPDAVQYGTLSVLLLKEVQELRAEVDRLTAVSE